MDLQQTIRHRESDSQMKKLITLLATAVFAFAMVIPANAQARQWVSCQFIGHTSYDDERWRTTREVINWSFWHGNGVAYTLTDGNRRNYNVESEVIGGALVFTATAPNTVFITVVESGPEQVEAVHSKYVGWRGITATHYAGSCNWTL